MKILDKFTTFVASHIGDIKVYGHLMFFDFKYRSYVCVSKEKYFEVKKLLDSLGNKPCIIGRYYSDFLSSKFMKSKLISHVGLYTGRELEGKPDAIIHAVGEGVCVESLLKFMSCDKIYIMSVDLDEEKLNKVVDEAIKLINTPYDFTFSEDDKTLYCSELIYNL